MTRRRKGFDSQDFWVAVKVSKDGDGRRRVQIRSCDVAGLADVYRPALTSKLLERIEEMACRTRDSDHARGLIELWQPPFSDFIDRDTPDHALLHQAWAARAAGVSRHTIMRAWADGSLAFELHEKRKVVRMKDLRTWMQKRMWGEPEQ